MPRPSPNRWHLQLQRKTEENQQVLQIAKGLAATLGNDFLQSVVRHLATCFQADCAYIVELAGAVHGETRTVAEFRKTRNASVFDHHLQGTACYQAISDGSFACARDARRYFPSDPVLRQWSAEGFVGIRLSDSSGRHLGVLAMLSKNGFENLHLVKEVAEAFIPRIEAELSRKREEDTHRENEERYQAFISANPDGMWRIELRNPLPLTLPEDEQVERVYRDGYVAECNIALALMAGAETAGELIGLPFGDVAERITPNARQELRKAVRSHFRSITVETSLPDGVGSTIHRVRSLLGIFDESGLRRMWGTIRDITALRRTELSLAASERRFREVLESVRLAAVMMDADGTVTFANECFLEMAQRSWEDTASRPWLKGIVPDMDGETWMANVLDDPDAPATRHFEGIVMPYEGKPRVIAWDAIVLRDSNNQIAGLAAIGRDITHQRALEMEIREAEKLEGIGRLAAGVAHDFNNLLMMVLGHTTEVLRQVPRDSPVYGRLTAVEVAATECTRLTSQLLAFGRRQQLKPSMISFNDIVDGNLSLIEGLLGEEIELVTHLESPLGLVFADPSLMGRVLTNLVTNARDAMSEGGVLTIETSSVEVEELDATYPGISSGRYVRLSVSDTGVGLTEEVRDQMFEPFFTTKDVGRGTGLGLSTVYGIVTQSGGHIVVTSEPGKGARFDLLFPQRR